MGFMKIEILMTASMQVAVFFGDLVLVAETFLKSR
jgi:hypothetical protein